MSVLADHRTRVVPWSLSVLALSISCSGQAQQAPAAATAPSVLAIGNIDFYGLNRLSTDRLRGALTFKEGDTIAVGERPPFLAESEARLAAIPGVTHARTTIVCCDNGHLIVYVGIEEEGAPVLRFHAVPLGSVRLAGDVVQTGDELSQGAREVQNRLIGYAKRDLPNLRAVLRDSADAKHRALAAQVLGYVDDKQAVVDDLVYALGDADDGVRNDALRTLLVFAEAPPTHSRLSPRVPYAPFIALLDSPAWTDRNQSSVALAVLSKDHDPDLLAAVRARALTPLVEIARWKSAAHARAGFILLGRAAGFSEQDLSDNWERGEREKIIRLALSGQLPPGAAGAADP
jgi:HEAT repeats